MRFMPRHPILSYILYQASDHHCFPIRLHYNVWSSADFHKSYQPKLIPNFDAAIPDYQENRNQYRGWPSQFREKWEKPKTPLEILETRPQCLQNIDIFIHFLTSGRSQMLKKYKVIFIILFCTSLEFFKNIKIRIPVREIIL